VAHGWTVSSLARLCGVSRSTFAARFRAIVGTGPIEYLLHWRMALAKDELSRGTRSIGEIGLGYWLPVFECVQYSVHPICRTFAEALCGCSSLLRTGPP
jgi:hypothetical protein